jgi:hypothetical protein
MMNEVLSDDTNRDVLRSRGDLSARDNDEISYRLVHKYMRQPRPMKLSRTNTDGNFLSSDAVSIALAYFLNSPHPSLKYAIQFSLIQTPQHPLHALKN